MELLRGFEDLIYKIFVFCVGACVGSFLNVCILRLPKGKSIVSPASMCACGKAIKWYDNIPILSWFILRGKSRCCKTKFSFRYVFVEVICAVLFLSAWIMLGRVEAIVAMFFVSLMILVTFIDIDTLELPDWLTVGGAFAGLVLSTIFPQIHNAYLSDYPYLISAIRGLLFSSIGLMIGVGLLYFLRLTAEIAFNKEAMGEGDVVLMACIGAFCGWQGALFSIFIGSLIGAVIMLPLYPIMKKKGEDLMIPYGPWLALGAIVFMLFCREITEEYFSTILYMLTLTQN